MLKLRLHGKPEELAEFTMFLESLSPELEILSQSGKYVDRGTSKYQRVYLDVELKKENAAELLRRLKGG